MRGFYLLIFSFFLFVLFFVLIRVIVTLVALSLQQNEHDDHGEDQCLHQANEMPGELGNKLGADGAVLGVSLILVTAGALVIMNGTLGVIGMIVGNGRHDLKFADGAELAGNDGCFSAGGVLGEMLLGAAELAGVPVAGLISADGQAQLMGDGAGKATVVTFCVTVIVIGVGAFAVPLRAVDTFVPVIFLVATPFFQELVDMAISLLVSNFKATPSKCP